jgi:polysaccharide chain length determinant protein (PEP-CTERM system associated)
MSVEFRQRTPSEYLKLAWKRKWLIVLPAIAVASAVAWVVYRLPDVYESSTLIVVKPSTLPSGVVPTLTDDTLTRQLTSITQVVTSRSSLEPLVKKYELYRNERLRGQPMEVVIEMMRNSIIVEVNTSRNDITNGFNISYKGRDPKTTQAVAAELASKYINEQTKVTITQTQSAKEFIDRQVEEVKKELDEIDKRRVDYMEKNLSSLPTGAASLIGQLNGLRDQQKAYISEVGRLQDRRSALATNLTLLKKQNQQTIDDLAKNITDPKTTLAWSQLVGHKAELEGQLTTLKQQYTAKHPDVIAKQKELDQVKQDMDQMVAEWKDKIKQEQERLKDRVDISAANVENEIKLVDGEIKREQALIGEIEKQIAQVTERINNVPGTEVALGSLEREYQTKKANYDQLLSQQQKISLGADAASQQQGEGIQVIDSANLPVLPVAPKRWTLSGLGLAVGLGLGVLLAGLFEIPKLFTIQTTEDAAHYTGLPVLISVPELLSPKELRALPMRRRLALAAGVVATLIMIPALKVALNASHVFERFIT